LVVALSIGKPLLNGVPCRGWRVPETDATPSILSVHIEETIQLIAGLNAEHHANATYHQRAVDRITSLLGRASFIATLLWGTTKIVLSSYSFAIFTLFHRCNFHHHHNLWGATSTMSKPI
jgi:hypothetical protein